jgi:hypothetical protein
MLVGCTVLAPVVFLAVKGLVGLIVAVLLGYSVIQFAPVVALWLANLRLKALVGEVSRNPIETMQNLYLEKAAALDTAEQRIVAFQAEIANFDENIVEFKRQYPDDAGSYEEISSKMKAGLRAMKQAQTEARAALADLKERIKKAEMIFNMAKAAQSVTALSRQGERAVFQDIESQVAFGAVQRKLNVSLASLDAALSQRIERPALPAGGRP